MVSVPALSSVRSLLPQPGIAAGVDGPPVAAAASPRASAVRARPTRTFVRIAPLLETGDSARRAYHRGSGLRVPASVTAVASPFVELEVGERVVKLTNPDKVLFPKARKTKRDLAEYYIAVGDGIVRALYERPTQLRRFPDGIDGRDDLPEARPGEASGVGRGGARHVPVGASCGRALRHRARAGGLGGEPRGRRLPPVAVAPPRHRASRRAPHRHRPAARDDVQGREACRRARAARCSRRSATSGWPKTSGNRGIHVSCRIEPKWEFPVVRRAALAFAREIERRLPNKVTTAWWKEERGRRVFIDYNQNARDRTIASAYSVRARKDAAVSAPVTWDELPDVATEDFTMTTMPKRFAKLGDVQAGIDDERVRPARPAGVGRARREDGSRRGAVPAELPEDAGRAAARAAVEGTQAGVSDGIELVRLDLSDPEIAARLLDAPAAGLPRRSRPRRLR